MRLSKLHIGEFGILRNQRLDDINSEIVLIAGANRAGKTTFMQLLRYLAYPFPRTDEIPPQVGGYSVEADYVSESGEKLVVYRDGLSDPRLISETTRDEREIREHFIDGFTYRQLFTLSLDELRKIPAGVDNKQMRQLQSILLGAGLADLALLPEIIDSFQANAKNIGGKLGNPSVREFKPYYEKIQDGITQRSEANRQVDEFDRLSGELQETENLIDQFNASIREKELERDRLELLKSSYSLYQKFSGLNQKLSEEQNRHLLESFPEEKMRRAEGYLEEYPGILEEFREKRNRLIRDIAEDNWEEQYHRVLEHRQQLQQWERNISGMEQRVNEFTELREKQSRRYMKLQNKISSLQSGWSTELAVLDEIQVDEIQTGELREQVSEYHQTQMRKRNAEDELTEFESDLEAKKAVLNPQAVTQLKRNIWILSGMGLLSVLAGVMLVLFVDALIGGLAGGGLTLIFIVLMLIQYFQKSDARTNLQTTEQAIDEIETRIEKLSRRIAELSDELRQRDISLDQFRQKMKLPESTDPKTIENFYLELRNIKDSYDEWKSAEKNLRQKRESIRTELNELSKLLRIDLDPDEPNRLAEHFRILKTTLDAQLKQLESALDFSELQNQREQIETDIQKLLTGKSGQLSLEESLSTSEQIIYALKEFVQRGHEYAELKQAEQERDNAKNTLLLGFSGRVKRAFVLEENFDEKGYLDLLGSQYEKFISEEDVQRKLQDAERQLIELNNNLDDHQQKAAKLEQILDDLATSEKLDDAQAQIDSARSGLEPLAREYAVNQLAAYLLERVRDDYLESTQGELLVKASEYFRRLTSDTYTSILPPAGLESADFIAESGDAEPQEVDILSRGTREQLFFAVRLSRIMELDPLPVIFDDSFVNFDVQHRQQAAQIVGELAHRNQVFVLTCHPEIIDYIANQNISIQYWLLDEGHIQLSGYDQVQNVLNS